MLSLLMLAVVALASVDFVRLSKDSLRRPGHWYVRLFRCCAKWAIPYLIVQAGATWWLVRLAGEGGQGLRAFYLLVVANAACFLVVLPSGFAWQLRAGWPVAPLARRRWVAFQPYGVTCATLAGMLALPIVVSIGLFSLVPWSVVGPATIPESASWVTGMLVFVHLAVTSAIQEEVILRHYLMARLAVLFARAGVARGDQLAILVTAVLFAMLHAGLVEPEWLKFTQIFVLAVVLGLAQRRYGLGAAILLHLGFNVLSPAVAAVCPPIGS